MKPCVQHKYEPDDTIMNWLVNNPDFSMFTKLVYESGFDRVLRNRRLKITLFAVPNEYIKRIKSIETCDDFYFAKTVVSLSIARIPIYDIIGKYVVSTYYPDLGVYVIVNGVNGGVNGGKSICVINNSNEACTANVINNDVIKCNGVIHVIDSLLIPPCH